jgi:prefoldin alpha subunit
MSNVEISQEQLSYELAVYREQIAMIKRETERISLTTIDLTNALRTVESLRVERALIPIGGGTMVRGDLTQTRVLVPIGAEYLVEMEREMAEGELRRRIDGTKKAVEKLNEEFNKIVTKLRDASHQLQKIEAQSQLSQRVEGNIHEDYI